MASKIAKEIQRAEALRRRGAPARAAAPRATAPQESDKTRIQTLIFSKEDFTEREAKRWAKENGFSSGYVDEKENTYRIRQRDPELFAPSSFRTIRLAPGVQAVVGHPFVV